MFDYNMRYMTLTDNDQEGVMDNLIQALNTGTAFNVRERKEGRRRTPRAAGGKDFYNLSVHTYG